MARKLIVEIVGDSRSYERAMGRSTKASKQFGTSVTGMTKSASLGFGTLLKGAAAITGVTAGITAFTSAVRVGIDEYTQMATVAAQTNAVLKSTGGVANVSAKDVDALATSLSQLSGVDDEAIASAENLILTFKRVRNTTGEGNRIFDRATLAALDLSKAAGGAFGDLPTTAKQLAKALNDPVRGMTALGRAGVTFTEAQREVIKSLVETGDILGAQKIILREVESQVGGSAKAFGQTLPGQLSKLRESFRNTFGEIIAAVVPPLEQELLPVLQQASASMREWAGDSANQAKIQQKVRTAIQAVVAVAKTFKAIFDAVAPIIERVATAVGGTENAVRLLVAAMATAKLFAFTSAITGLGTAALTSTARVDALRLALLKLRVLGPIAIIVTVVVYRKQINEAGKKVNRWLNDALPGNPFGGGVGIDIPFTVGNLSKLVLARAALAKIRGEDDARVVVLDKIITRLREIEKERKAKLTVETEYVVKVTGDRIPGDLPSPSGTAGKPKARPTKVVTPSVTPTVTATKVVETETERTARLKAAAEEGKRKAEEAAAALRRRNEALREAGKIAQFKELGLTGTGERPTPGTGSLLNRAQSLQKQIKGTVLDTDKTRSRLRRIVRFLRNHMKTAGRDVRQAILGMLNDVSSGMQGKGEAGGEKWQGEITKGSIRSTQMLTRGLGLTDEQREKIKNRNLGVSGRRGFGAFGVAQSSGVTGMGRDMAPKQPIIISLQMDGKEISSVVLKDLQSRGSRFAGSRRGVRGGVKTGLG